MELLQINKKKTSVLIFMKWATNMNREFLGTESQKANKHIEEMLQFSSESLENYTTR